MTNPLHVAVAAFHGPLDLLLYLVKREEVDPRDVPMAVLADQFVAYLAHARDALDVDLAGDFLVMAATLMELKSRALVPADPAAEAADDADDPRRELVRQLIEYRKFKDAAAALDDRADRQAVRVPRAADPPPAGGPPPVRPVELWDLVSAFARLVRETQPTAAAVVADDTPQHVYEGFVRDRVSAAGRLTFRDLFTPPHHKPRLIGLFLAVLELVKRGAVAADQPALDGDIWLAVPAAPPAAG